MLGPADDYLIHQTHEPVAHAFTSDRRYYDRYFFTGHKCSEDLFFMLGMGAYPNLGVIDAFASVSRGTSQSTTRASRELGGNRMDTSGVGPFGVKVIEGLKNLRLTCAPSGQAVSFDLEWISAVPALLEPPLLQRTMGRVMEQGTRMIQTGCWAGHIEVEGERHELTPDCAWGARDRSWGVRSIGLEREPRGIQQANKVAEQRAPLWIWSPMQFKGYSIHFNISEHANGEREVENVQWIDAFSQGGESHWLRQPEHQLKFDPVTRELQSGSNVSFLDTDGRRRTVQLKPLRRTYLRAGTGYGGPDPWRHGMYMGKSWCDSVRYDLQDEAVTARIGPTHVLCRMTMDDGDVGYGTFETQVFGAFPRYGFNE